MKAKEPDLMLTQLEEYLLTALRGRPLYGLDILRAVAEASGGKRKIGFGSLYPALHKLEKRGFVSSYWGEDRPEERAGARRKYYKITGIGERARREAEQIRVNLAAWQPAEGRA